MRRLVQRTPIVSLCFLRVAVLRVTASCPRPSPHSTTPIPHVFPVVRWARSPTFMTSMSVSVWLWAGWNKNTLGWFFHGFLGDSLFSLFMAFDAFHNSRSPSKSVWIVLQKSHQALGPPGATPCRPRACALARALRSGRAVRTRGRPAGALADSRGQFSNFEFGPPRSVRAREAGRYSLRRGLPAVRRAALRGRDASRQ